jgi:hypothetical protein
MTWRVAPRFLLRQAGFPFQLLDALHQPDAVDQTGAVDTSEAALRRVAADLRAVLRSAADPVAAQRAAVRVGQLQSLKAELVERLDACLSDVGRRALHNYSKAQLRYHEAVAGFDADHQALLDAQRARVVAAFRDDPRLRGVLLLSNDAQYELFESWFSDPGQASWNRRTRRRADLFTLYLQRVTTKNETNSHFGPVSIGSFAADGDLSWSDTAPERRSASFSHWAAEEIGRVLADRPSLRAHVRPRRNPLALRDQDQVYLYESTTGTGLTADWTFTQQPPRSLAGHERWLFDHADGVQPLGRLHELWPGDPAVLDAAVKSLCADRLLFAHFEIPVGAIDPLGVLIDQLPRDHPEADEIVLALTEMRALVADFARGEHESRIRTLAALKSRFEQVSGHAANRFQGRHYADRGVLYEECLAQVDDVVAGPWLRGFVTGDLSVCYDLVLVGPRHRMRRERALMAEWFTGQFGPRGDVSLLEFYRGYFADRDQIICGCESVEDELAAIDADIVQSLVGAAAMDAAEIEVDRAAVDEFLRGWPTTPAAVCNPDLMLAAGSREDLVAGRFLAVIGDCHAMRELLTHSSVGTLIAERHPAFAAQIVEHYQGLLDEDEVICDVMRSHLDKTDTQMRLPILDVEFLGRSPKGPGDVVSATQLRLRHDERTGLSLYAEGRQGRLRLLAPPATGPSVARDPLAIFSFPRYFGGVALRGGDAEHLPRFRCGRVVLQRELWRVECTELDVPGDGAGFRAATRLRQRLQLPRFVFAKHPGEPKPVFVDFESPLLVAQLVRLARRRIGSVLISEMLPGPDQLWLTAQGRSYTSEVRLAVFG